jgi:hypothetical protein
VNRRDHRIDAYVRRLPLISDQQVRLQSDDTVKEWLFQEVTAVPVDTASPRRTRSPRRAPTPRRTLVLVALLTMLTLASVGWAVAQRLSSDADEVSTSLGCYHPDGSIAIVSAATGDPIEDCAHEWERAFGTEPPEFVTYETSTGGIVVAPADAEVPDHLDLERVDPPDAIDDPRLIELEAALDDQGGGLGADCYTLDEARRIVKRELDQLGLTGWTVTSEDGGADGNDTCTGFSLDRAPRQIVLRSQSAQDWVTVDGHGDDPIFAFARDVNAALEDRCLTLGDAADLVRKRGAAAGMNELGLDVREVVDNDAACARVDVEAGGAIFVTVKGPKTIS